MQLSFSREVLEFHKISYECNYSKQFFGLSEVAGSHGAEYEDGCLLLLRRVVWWKFTKLNGAAAQKTVIFSFLTVFDVSPTSHVTALGCDVTLMILSIEILVLYIGRNI
jgi:hypothetical protein